MSRPDIIRAWKDEDYRRSLTSAERALLPENPAGVVELTDAELGAVFGAGTYAYGTLGCCGSAIVCIGLTFAIGTGGCCYGGLTN
ncbi:MAG TPA: mersacidin/lichenicidin family type 2 lantibiotic [Pyrinomonadaceae bacterium]|nr:mersacidin/lichenicidin family type 2 lantibiotic [Pyrinomonadaceae bacterium]